MIPKMPPHQINITVHIPSLADALDEKSEVKKVFRKYGKEDPYKKKPVPSMQWEGDNQG